MFHTHTLISGRPVCPQFLPKNLHLVCVDMPGHEGTTRSSLDDLSIDGQVKRIHQVSRRRHQKLPRLGLTQHQSPIGTWKWSVVHSVCKELQTRRHPSGIVGQLWSARTPGRLFSFKPVAVISKEK